MGRKRRPEGPRSRSSRVATLQTMLPNVTERCTCWVEDDGNMGRVVPVSEARSRLTQLANELADSQESVTITSRGKPMLAMIGYELYESIMETLEIMSDPDLMAQLRKSLEEARSGEVIDIDEVERELI